MTKMHEPPVLHWDRVIHKSARTEDGAPIGYIAAEDTDSIIVLSRHFREYCIPKSHVKSLDGSQLYLDFLLQDLEEYGVQ
jgi:hypothetical protein